jgi:hypothetical protein
MIDWLKQRTTWIGIAGALGAALTAYSQDGDIATAALLLIAALGALLKDRK